MGGCRLTRVQVCPPRLRAWSTALSLSRVVEVEAIGKHLLIHLDGGLSIHSHLMMWGRWEVVRQGAPFRKATGRLWLSLETGRHVAALFNGPVLEVLTREHLPQHPVLTKLGPDPLRADYRREEARARLTDPRRARTPLAHVLLDQEWVCGVGNIYKSEILWHARLSPLQPPGDLTPSEVERLLDCTERVLRVAYRQRFGTLPRRVWRTLGPFAVYRRTGQPCLRCGARIARLDTGRATYWCPSCQSPVRVAGHGP